MADLQCSPPNIEQRREDNVVSSLTCLVIRVSTVVLECGNESTNHKDAPKDVPRLSLPYITKHSPILVLILSERAPTIGVDIPSANCPAKIA